MSDRVADEFACVEDIRLGIMEDLISRYLSDEIDLRQFTDFVTISRLHYPWPKQYSGGRLRELIYHHLYFYHLGDWPESTLRTSLAQLQTWVLNGDSRWGTAMVDTQWLALLKAGHVPQDGGFFQHTEE